MAINWTYNGIFNILTKILLQIPSWIQWWKKFKIRPIFGKVINEKYRWSFFEITQNVLF